MENAPFVILNLFPIWLTLVSVVVTYIQQAMALFPKHSMLVSGHNYSIFRFRPLAMALLPKNNWLASGPNHFQV